MTLTPAAQAAPQFTAHLAACTTVLLNELETPKVTQKAIAQTYALAMRSDNPTDWGKVNLAIIAKWSPAGLMRVKRMAHSGRCWK